MANLAETSNFDDGVYQLELTDPVQGGATGVDNKPLLNLANRTRWLKDQITSILGSLAAAATLNSPTFTGSPKAPTSSAGDSSTALATTAFVNGLVEGMSTVSCSGSANVTLSQAQYGVSIITLTGVLTGNINLIFPTQTGKWLVVNNTTGAFTVTAKTAGGSGYIVRQGFGYNLYGDGTNILPAGVQTFSGPAAAPTLQAMEVYYTTS